MYWSIFLLDVGVVVPLSVAAAVALLRQHRIGQMALYGVVGWFALVPPSVAAMSVVKLLRGDPNAAAADAVLFVVVSLVFAAIAVLAYRPLFHSSASERAPASYVGKVGRSRPRGAIAGR